MSDTAVASATVTEQFDGTIESAYGNKLDTALSFSGSYEAYRSLNDVPAEEQPSAKDILQLVNNKRKANARQKAMQDALDKAGIKKPTLEDSAEQFKQMVKILMANKKSEEQAKQIANATLGTSY